MSGAVTICAVLHNCLFLVAEEKRHTVGKHGWDWLLQHFGNVL